MVACTACQAAILVLVWSRCLHGNTYNYHYMEDFCQPGSPAQDVVNLTETGISPYGFVRVVHSGGYPHSMDCSLVVSAPGGHRLTVRIRRVETESGPDCGPDYLDSDYLEIKGNDGSRYYCGEDAPSSSLASVTTTLTFRFYSFPRSEDLNHDKIGFDLYYTAFHTDECGGEEFRCSYESRCIPQEVTCDKLDNCGDWSDEETSVCGLSTGAIVTISIILALLFGTCVSLAAYYFYEERKRKRKAAARRQNGVAPYDTTGAVTHGVNFTTVEAVFEAPNQYVVGVEPPPAYTFVPDEIYHRQEASCNTLAGYGQLGLPYGTSPAYDTPIPESDYSWRQGALPLAPNIPPPAYDNPGYSSSGSLTVVDEPVPPSSSTIPPPPQRSDRGLNSILTSRTRQPGGGRSSGTSARRNRHVTWSDC